MDIDDVLNDKSLWPAAFKGWGQMMKKYWRGMPCLYKPETQFFVASRIIKKYFELATKDMYENGKEIGFFYKDEPYMSWGIKDMRHVSKKYVYRAKFRGHMYVVFIEMSPEFEKKMTPMIPITHLDRHLYYKLSRLVQNGMDYDEAPNPPYHFLKGKKKCQKKTINT